MRSKTHTTHSHLKSVAKLGDKTTNGEQRRALVESLGLKGVWNTVMRHVTCSVKCTVRTIHISLLMHCSQLNYIFSHLRWKMQSRKVAEATGCSPHNTTGGVNTFTIIINGKWNAHTWIHNGKGALIKWSKNAKLLSWLRCGS